MCECCALADAKEIWRHFYTQRASKIGKARTRVGPMPQTSGNNGKQKSGKNSKSYKNSYNGRGYSHADVLQTKLRLAGQGQLMWHLAGRQEAELAGKATNGP